MTAPEPPAAASRPRCAEATILAALATGPTWNADTALRAEVACLDDHTFAAAVRHLLADGNLTALDVDDDDGTARYLKLTRVGWQTLAAGPAECLDGWFAAL